MGSLKHRLQYARGVAAVCRQGEGLQYAKNKGRRCSILTIRGGAHYLQHNARRIIYGFSEITDDVLTTSGDISLT